MASGSDPPAATQVSTVIGSCGESDPYRERISEVLVRVLFTSEGPRGTALAEAQLGSSGGRSFTGNPTPITSTHVARFVHDAGSAGVVAPSIATPAESTDWRTSAIVSAPATQVGLVDGKSGTVTLTVASPYSLPLL